MTDDAFISILETDLLVCQDFAERIENPSLRQNALDYVGDLVMMLCCLKHRRIPVSPGMKPRILATLRNMKDTYRQHIASN